MPEPSEDEVPGEPYAPRHISEAPSETGVAISADATLAAPEDEAEPVGRVGEGASRTVVSAEPQHVRDRAAAEKASQDLAPE